MPRDLMPSSQVGQAAFESGLATGAPVLLPIEEPDSGGSISWLALALLRHLGEHDGGCSAAVPSLAEGISHCTPCLHIGAVSGSFAPEAASLVCDPGSLPKASHHAFGPRSLPGITRFHARRGECFASPHFFPRSVGFGPTASGAIGASTMAPSKLCHDQAIPSSSSYSAKRLRHRFTKNPFFSRSRKYLCTELALPNSDLCKAFHWHLVSKTYATASSTLRGSIAFRPPPGRRRYVRFVSRRGFEMSGLARSHNSCKMVHDLMVFTQRNCRIKTALWQYLFADKI
jgi:hypothetical protein